MWYFKAMQIKYEFVVTAMTTVVMCPIKSFPFTGKLSFLVKTNSYLLFYAVTCFNI